MLAHLKTNDPSRVIASCQDRFIVLIFDHLFTTYSALLATHMYTILYQMLLLKKNHWTWLRIHLDHNHILIGVCESLASMGLVTVTKQHKQVHQSIHGWRCSNCILSGKSVINRQTSHHCAVPLVSANLWSVQDGWWSAKQLRRPTWIKDHLTFLNCWQTQCSVIC